VEKQRKYQPDAQAKQEIPEEWWRFGFFATGCHKKRAGRYAVAGPALVASGRGA
jgi:hypothetical protein